MAPTSPHGTQLTTLSSWICPCSLVMASVLLASLSGYVYTWQWKLGQRDIAVSGVSGLPSLAPQQGPEWVLLNKPPCGGYMATHQSEILRIFCPICSPQ